MLPHKEYLAKILKKPTITLTLRDPFVPDTIEQAKELAYSDNLHHYSVQTLKMVAKAWGVYLPKGKTRKRMAETIKKVFLEN